VKAKNFDLNLKQKSFSHGPFARASRHGGPTSICNGPARMEGGEIECKATAQRRTRAKAKILFGEAKLAEVRDD